MHQQLEQVRNERDSTLDKGEAVAQRIADLTMQLHGKENEMREQYRREEKTMKNMQRLKETISKQAGETEKLMRHIMNLDKDQKQAQAEIDRLRLDLAKSKAFTRALEYTVAAANKKVKDFDQVLGEVARGIPSEAITAVLTEIQQSLATAFELEESILVKEASLAASEAEL